MTKDETMLVKEWMHETGAQVKHAEIKMARYSSPLQAFYAEDSLSTAIPYETRPAFELLVAEDDLVDLIKKRDLFVKLMRLPEVRQAMFYYSLSGEFDE